MNNLLLTLKRPLIKLCRIRHRCGYGVHSPFAFRLITDVIYQRLPYYAYLPLIEQEKQTRRRLRQQASSPDELEQARHWDYEPLKTKRLLFRLVNEVQPARIIDVGRIAASSLYLKAAKSGAEYTGAGSLDELFLEADMPVDFLYLHHYQDPALAREVLRTCLPRTCSRSLFVIEGIGYTPAMRQLWKQVQEDPHTGITFDLYDLGLVFFDLSKQKQHYTISY